MNRFVVMNFLLGLLLPLASVQADTVRLYQQAQVQTSSVRLADVAKLQGPVISRLGQTVLIQLARGQSSIQISLQQVRQHLHDFGVDVSGIVWEGPSVCLVEESRFSQVRANLGKVVHSGSKLTFEAQLVAYLADWTGLKNQELVVTFSDRDRQRLSKSVTAGRLEFEPSGRGALGRIPVVVRHWQGDRLVEELRVTAMVARRTLAIVLVNPARRGQVFGLGDLQVREVLLDRGRSEPLRKLAQVIGQSARHRLRSGRVLFAEDIAPSVLIHKGQRVMVRCMVGGVLVRTLARAEQDGVMDEAITFRNEKSRDTFTARVSGAREAILVLGSGAGSRAVAGGGREL